MENPGKPILVTNLDGLLLKHSAFVEPHKAWFEARIKETGDESLREWIGKKDYFRGVDIAMKQAMPDATDAERTIQARNWYQQDVLKHIREHPEVVYREIADALNRLKDKFTLALITDSAEQYIHLFLEAAGLKDVFDIVLAIDVSEKPDKIALINRFVEKYGVPSIYLGARNIEVFKTFGDLKIRKIYTAWDEFDKDIALEADVTVRNLSDLGEALSV